MIKEQRMPQDQEPRAKNQRSTLFGSRLAVLGAPPRWQRLLLLACATTALAMLGAWLGRGLGGGAGVIGVAVVPPALAATAAPSAVPAAAEVTATPAIAAISAPPAAAQPAEAWPALLREPFEQASAEWPELPGSTWRARLHDGGYELELSGRPSISYSARLPARDFWLSAEVRLGSGSAGLFCLLRRPNDFYRFLIDAEGRYRLELQQVGVSQPLIDWTASDALRTGAGALNVLAARREGGTLTLYANGVQLASYLLPPGELEGRVGIALDAPAGTRAGSAWFDNLEVRAPAP